jgi:hypothetical protein
MTSGLFNSAGEYIFGVNGKNYINNIGKGFVMHSDNFKNCGKNTFISTISVNYIDKSTGITNVDALSVS